jgi:cytochrome c-type biogenesis protein CcsB
VNVELALLRVALALYLVGSVIAMVGISVRRDLPETLLPRVLWVAAGLHALAILIRSLHIGHFAVTTFNESLSFFALMMIAVFLLVQLRRPLMALATVVTPLAFALTLASDATYRGAEPLPPVLDSAWRPVHVVLAILGDAVFALAFSASLLYLLQERRLKSRRGGLLRHFPSLETLDRLNYACLKWGLILLTLGIVSGVVWAHTAWDRFWSSDPKLILSVVIWGIYVVLLQGRMTAGWRGRWAATLTIAGFVVIVLSLIGVNVLGLGKHGRSF